MVTTQGPNSISIGRCGPCCHCICPAARNSLVLGLLVALPPIMKTPTELRLVTALRFLGIVKFPILLSAQRWLLLSRTIQEVVGTPSTSPPQVAITGLGSDVKNVTCSSLPAGSSGAEQLFVLGKTSTEVMELLPANPPVIKRRFSSESDGALVVGERSCQLDLRIGLRNERSWSDGEPGYTSYLLLCTQI